MPVTSVKENSTYKVLFRKMEWKVWLRSQWFHLKFIKKFGLNRAKRKSVLYVVHDPRYKHAGLADQLEVFCSCYYFAKQSGIDFKIVFETPFKLADFMSENEVEWHAEPSDLEYSVADTRFYVYMAGRSGMQSPFRKGLQYHCYGYSGDNLFEIHKCKDHRERFGELFRELFKPSQSVLNEINKVGLEPGHYVSIHTRFVNALERFEDPRYPTLPADKQELIIARCRQGIKDIMEQEKMPVVVFSDSKRFLDAVSDLPVIILDTTNIAHICHTSNDSAIAKTFLDFWVMSLSHKVFRLKSEMIYCGGFSYCASAAGGVELIDYNVD